MDLTFSTEQIQLRDSVARFVTDRGVGSTLQRPAECRSDVWRQLAGLGLLGAGLAEEQGGFGGGAVENMIIMEAMGRGLMPEPLLDGLMATHLLASAPSEDGLLAALVAGDTLVMPALLDGAPDTPAQLRDAGDALALHGSKVLVAAADQADRLVVSCLATDGAPALVTVDPAAEGVAVHAHRTLDARRVATVVLDGVAVAPAQVLARGDAAKAALAMAQATGVAALCAEATGVAAFLFDQTLEYLKVRKQFGQPIGRFQALQHRMADMFVALEEARSLSVMAAFQLSGVPVAAREHALSAAKIGVTSRAMHIAREAIQMHGGIGMTEELPVGAGFRRIKTLQLMLGDENHHLDQMAATRDLATTSA